MTLSFKIDGGDFNFEDLGKEFNDIIIGEANRQAAAVLAQGNRNFEEPEGLAFPRVWHRTTIDSAQVVNNDGDSVFERLIEWAGNAWVAEFGVGPGEVSYRELIKDSKFKQWVNEKISPEQGEEDFIVQEIANKIARRGIKPSYAIRNAGVAIEEVVVDELVAALGGSAGGGEDFK
jgi:hypothetical protein